MVLLVSLGARQPAIHPLLRESRFLTIRSDTETMVVTAQFCQASFVL
jgi:hypothetical protein